MWLVMTPEICRSTSSSLAAIKTIFGWTFQGATTRKSNDVSPKCMVCVLPSLIAPQRDFDTKQKRCKYSEMESTAIEQTQDAENIGRTVFHDFENNLPRHDEQYHVSFSQKCALSCPLKGNPHASHRQSERLHLKFANKDKLSQHEAFMRYVSRGRQVSFLPHASAQQRPIPVSTKRPEGIVARTVHKQELIYGQGRRDRQRLRQTRCNRTRPSTKMRTLCADQRRNYGP